MAQEELRAPESLLQPSFPPALNCFSRDSLRFFLTRQLLEARRYGYFIGISLFRIESPNGKNLTNRVVQSIAQSVRRTDYIGLLNDNTVGVILQHTTVRDAARVLERLRQEIRQFCPTEGLDLIRSSVAVFPTEANTLGELQALAEQRLTRSSPV